MTASAAPDNEVTLAPLSGAHIDSCVSLWNACRSGCRPLHYAPMISDTFTELFLSDASDRIVINLVALQAREVIGFASGTLRSGGEQGYITVVLVRDGDRRRGVGTRLLDGLEARLAAHGQPIDRYEVMFFNPVNIRWIVPGTDLHDHPNAPGVDVSCDGYLFLKNRGYRDVAYQNSYYLSLSYYRYPVDIESGIATLARGGIRIVRYDPHRHSGLNELFDDLGNDEWRRIVGANFAPDGPADPVLVVEDGDRVCGFTGPIRVQQSGRGYFAGIGVHSDYRGRGAGKALFAALCMELTEIGASFMTLFTGETNPARNIYEAAGFRIVRTWADMRRVL
ncbi:MAG: GNAT family N-acetyltransferase [Spirochaetaceae bacterium]|nr:MAG: GNAT family N-acetyltransferase [Spirochaetaceae bacterium]